MTGFFHNLLRWPQEWWQSEALRGLLEQQWGHVTVFVLVLARLSGLMAVGPLLGRRLIPLHVRCWGVICLAGLLTPGLARLGRSQDGLPLVPLAVTGAAADGLQAVPDSVRDALSTGMRFSGFALSTLHEFMLGLALGLGVCTLLTGVQLAGELIDQQSGGVFGTLSPVGTAGGGSGPLLFGLAAVMLLVSDAYLDLMRVVLESFQALPPGEFRVTRPLAEELTRIVGQSFLFAVHLAVPTLATMSLLALALGILGQTVPQMNVFSVGLPLRVLANVLVLLLTLPALRDHVLGRLPGLLQDLRMMVVF